MTVHPLFADTSDKAADILEPKHFTPTLQAKAVPIAAPPSARRTARFKLWELQDCWYCMVIGTCLTLAEVRQAARKAGLEVEGMSDYEAHRLAVECAANRKHLLTQRVQRLLDRKFDVQIKRFRRANTPAELESLWCEEWQAGHVGAGLWALVTHPRATADLVHRVYGEIHMMSHLAGARSCVDVGRLTSQAERIEQLEKSLVDAQRKTLEGRESLLGQIQDLRAQLKRARQQRLDDLARQAEAARQQPATAAVAKQHHAVQLVGTLRQQVSQLREERKQAAASIQQLTDENQRIEKALIHSLQDSAASTPDSLELCGRCVLYLGGKAQQCRHFQALVEDHSGRFLHHDGGLEDSGQRIAELVKQADAVLCPTDCISHSAMKKARLLCDKQDKPMIFMPRASLSAFASSLEQVASRF